MIETVPTAKNDAVIAYRNKNGGHYVTRTILLCLGRSGQSIHEITNAERRTRGTRQTTTLTGNSQQIAIQQCNAVSASSKCEKALGIDQIATFIFVK